MSDFTEAAFRELIELLLSQGYDFARFGTQQESRHVLWRHDLDFSVHRARALARIEHSLGAAGTYFVNPRSTFYNVFETVIADLLLEIAELGHEIGLHFDPVSHGQRDWHLDDLETAMRLDSEILEKAIQRRPTCVSWHNPDRSDVLRFDADEIAGMSSAYSGRLRREYRYCSDSNGYWRFTPMAEVIAQGHAKLHLLTHPEWWTPEEMSPWERTLRSINGRANANLRGHEQLIRKAGRQIPGSSPQR